MSYPLTARHPCLRLPLFQGVLRCVAERARPLRPAILAFWALWHCRHARPPDALAARH